MKNYNGKIQSVRRRYDSLKNFIARNEVHMAGDVLCVSTKNNDTYDLFLDADGVSTFLQLYAKRNSGGSSHGNVPVGGNSDGQINTFDEIVALLQGLPEGSNLKTILDNINTDGMSEEEKQALDDLVNGGDYTEEEAAEDWQEAMRKAGLDLTQEAGAASGEVDGGGDEAASE